MAQALRATLGRMGFTIPARHFLTDDQGLNNLDEFGYLTDPEVENLCKVTQRPGGTIANPNAAMAGQPAEIPDPGIPVSLCAENNLKMMCFYIRFKQRTSRAITAHQITLANVRSLRNLKRWETDHTNVDPPEIDPKDWPKTIHDIEEYLRGCLGSTKIPLAYVVRESPDIPALDPPEGYPSLQDELIARAPHFVAPDVYDPTFLDDRIKVWELLSALTRDHACFSYIRPGQATRNGRLAFQGLKNHYLGVNNVDNLANQAENNLANARYFGEQRRWNFEKYVKVHVDNHAILESLTIHGHVGIDERSKVRHLMNGVKCDALNRVKTRIMSDEKLRRSFSASVNLYKDFIKQLAPAKYRRSVAIAAVQSGSTKRSQIAPDNSVEDRYYTKEEYDRLSPAKKVALHDKRKNRGHKRGDKSSPVRPTKKQKTDHNQRSVVLSTRSVKAIAAALRPGQPLIDIHEEAEDFDVQQDQQPAAQPAQPPPILRQNRYNPALNRH